MKVCVCVTNFKNNLDEAISKTSVQLANKLAESVDCTLLVPGNISPLTGQTGLIKTISYAPEQDYASKVRVIKNIVALGQYFRNASERYDVIHFQTGNLLELFLIWFFVPRICAVRVITVWQPFIGILDFFKLPWIFRRNLRGIIHHYLFNTWLHAPLIMAGQFYFSKIIVHSNLQRKQLPFIKNKKIEVIANGVDGAERSNHDKGSDRNSSLRLLYIGHPTAVKGLDVLFEALERAAGKLQFQVTLALTSFKNVDPNYLIQKHGLEDRVTIKGQVNVYEEMSLHDLLVVPHKTQVGTSCYPNIVLEAFAAGLPLVASATEIMSEIVTDGVTGILVPPDNPAALESAIVRMLEDPGRRANMRKKQFEKFNQYFTLEKYVETHHRLYTVLTSESPNGSGLLSRKNDE